MIPLAIDHFADTTAAGILGVPISTAPADEPARMDRRTLGLFFAGCDSSLLMVEAIVDRITRGNKQHNYNCRVQCWDVETETSMAGNRRP